MPWWFWILVLLPVVTFLHALDLLIHPQARREHAMFPKSPLAEAGVAFAATVALIIVAIAVLIAY